MAVLSISSLLFTVLFATRVIALSNSSCYINDIFANGYPETTWTWTRYITLGNNETENCTSVWEAVDLKTTPALNLTDANTLPYTGCYMTLVGFDNSKKHAKGDGTCNTVFTPDCLKEIIAHANATAQSVSGSYRGNNTYFDCTDLTKDLKMDEKSKCWQQWGFSGSTQFLPDSSLTANAPNQLDRSCPSIDRLDPLARAQYFGSWRPDGGVDSFASYDPTLRNPLPLLISTWLKEDHSDGIMWQMGGGPADTRVICLPVNVPIPGSRNLTEVLNIGGGARVASLSNGMVGAIFLSLALGLVL